MKKLLLLLLSFALLFSACATQTKEEATIPIVPEAETQPVAKEPVERSKTDEKESIEGGYDYTIVLGEEITVNGESIQEISSHTVFLQQLVENHPDVSAEYLNTENQVLTLAAAGRYHISGVLTNGQIRVDTESKEDITLVLDGVEITNHTGPGLYILNSFEKDTAGEGQVTVYLAEGSKNSITASHLGKVELDTGETIKNDGAISSNQSFVIDGPGALYVKGDKEGIESKRHLTIQEGELTIEAMDDSINASEDGISHITINGGLVYAMSILGEEGDGIDSNGYITINGGTVIAVGHPTSMDSGLDSDLGITINGGFVAATGQMYDEIVSTSTQQFTNLTFSENQPENTLVVLTNSEEQPIFAYNSLVSFNNISLSSPQLIDGDYKVYVGGTIEGTQVEGMYTSIFSYTLGTLQQNTGSGGGRPFGGGPPPQGMTPPDGVDGQQPTPPQGMTPPREPQGGSGAQESGEASTIFTLSNQSHLFGGVSAAT